MPNNIINATSTGSGGLITTAADSGSLELQSDGTTIATLSSTGLTMAAGKKVFSEGSVLQVVSTNYATNTGYNSATPIDTGLSVSITPSSASNKIFVIANINDVSTNAAGAQNAKFTLTDGSNNVISVISDTYVTAYNVSSSSWATFVGQYLHSPATTSSFTYKIRVQGGSIQINNYNGTPATTSTITVMEIKG